LLEEALDVAEGLGASIFEVTTACAFLAFSRKPADACIIEVGLGGRLDATNVIPRPLICGIAALGIDHQSFLGDTLAEIAAEKAGIAKHGAPLVTLSYPNAAETSIDTAVARAGAIRLKQGDNWTVDRQDGRLRYHDRFGSLDLPSPHLAGAHQHLNAGLAIAMLRHQDAVTVGPEAVAKGIASAAWPARLQRLSTGPLSGSREMLLDGGHNASAAEALATALAGRKLHLVLGMLANKDAESFLRILAPVALSVSAVPIAHHDHHAPDYLFRIAESLGLTAQACPDVAAALAGTDGPVLITGSLYLAGQVLALNGEAPQ
jgi:dihydrofolate synthase/folylpolyglutamate synthase